ncbi:MAG: hypothetical protein KDA24_01870 [Deltaproteobacteria bacterium]|nr:hypothetical protein [Deltaproteobacteria bacterium]
MSAARWLALAVVSLGGACSPGCGPEKVSPTPSLAQAPDVAQEPSVGSPEPTPVPESAEPVPSAEVESEPATPPSTLEARRAVMREILGPQDLGTYEVGSAYDLGAIKMASLERSGDAQPITALSVAAQNAGFSTGLLQRAFTTGEGDGGQTHPLEVLGYDLVQPRGVGALTLGSRSMPRLDYAWLRVDEDSGVRENGSGSAVWLHCSDDSPGPVGDRFVLVSSEMPSDRYKGERLEAFLASLNWCAGP